MDDDFLQALAGVIRKQVAHRCEVELPGIGVFKAEHHKQYQQQYQDGRVVMMPPKDTIQFIPDSNWSDGD